MTILVTGSTGTTGSLVLDRLAPEDASVRALVRDSDAGLLVDRSWSRSE